MAAHVVFFRAEGLDTNDNPAVGGVRVREVVAIGDTSAALTAQREVVIVYNDESTAILVALGSAPDAAATTSSDATQAGFPVGPNRHSPPLVGPVGSKVSIKALA